ncbi:MAG: nuclease-related domain-containing protein [Rhodospirillales bacterium]|nr:nuclease-related domain-containing protein [Rhodospirillales bacterium]
MIERLVWRALFGSRRRRRSVFPRLFRFPPPNPTETGRAGEQMVASWMKREPPASIYRSFHDLMLPTPDGMTQIDHVFVSRAGVSVVETKNMGGWIIGNTSHRRWTQVLPGGRKQQFQKPLCQNHRHERAVEEALQGQKLLAEAVRQV